MERICFIFSLMLIPFLGINQNNGRWEKVMVSENKTICDDSTWELVFEDNFDGNTLNLSKWEIYTGVPRDHYFKTQKAWHKSENVLVADGLLKIVSQRKKMDSMPVVINWDPYIVKYDDFQYTSGEIWSKTKFTHGKLEARIKIPKGWGFCPAFWMYGAKKFSENKKPINNEIDVFEFWNEKKLSNIAKIHHICLHYDGQHRPSSYKGCDFSADFHVFTMIWDENKIEFYVDNILKRTDYKYKKGRKNIDCQLYSGKKYKRNKVFPTDPMNIILNIAIQSGKNTPNETTSFPSYMEVDYVRYYQKFENKVRQFIHSQLQMYPKSTLQDIYKNLFQDRFGPEHAISDTASARLYLEKELATFERSNSVEVDFLGFNHNYVRINLVTVKQGKIPQEKLLTAFCSSAKKINENDIKQWHEEWKKIVEIIKYMDLNIIDFEKDKLEIDSLLSQGEYAMHHSTVFRDIYQPHYRIVKREIFEQYIKHYL